MQLNTNLFITRKAIVDYSGKLYSEIPSYSEAKNSTELFAKIDPVIKEVNELVKNYKKSSEKSLKAKLKVYTPLVNHLMTINNIILEKKNFINKLFYWSPSEKKRQLDKLIKTIDLEYKEAINSEEIIWKGKRVIVLDEALLNQHKLSPKTKEEALNEDLYQKELKGKSYIGLKEALKIWQESYFLTAIGPFKEAWVRVMGRNKIESTLFEDPDFALSFKSISQDVENFKVIFQKDSLNPKQIKDLERILKILKNSIKLTRRMDFEGFLKKLPMEYRNQFETAEHAEANRQMRLADDAYAIQKKIARLPVGDSLLIPGGCTYGESGESTLFEITHETKNFYLFTIVNNGDGIYLKFNEQFNEIDKERMKDEQWKKSDYIIKDLLLEDISHMDFLYELINPTNMRNSLAPVVKYLLNNHPEGFQKGFIHRTERNERFLHDFIISWIESKMEDPLLFECLDLYMTKIGLEILSQCKLDELYKEKQCIASKTENGSYISKETLIPTLQNLGFQVFSEKKKRFKNSLNEEKEKALNENKLLLLELESITKRLNELPLKQTPSCLSIKDVQSINEKIDLNNDLPNKLKKYERIIEIIEQMSFL